MFNVNMILNNYFNIIINIFIYNNKIIIINKE